MILCELRRPLMSYWHVLFILDSKTRSFPEKAEAVTMDYLQYTDTFTDEETVDLNGEVALQYAFFPFQPRCSVPLASEFPF